MRFSYSPEISVIMPTFNRGRYLENAVESVIAQSVESWELIIVDDGSTDHTFEILSPYIERFANIRYLKHQNSNYILKVLLGRLHLYMTNPPHHQYWMINIA